MIISTAINIIIIITIITVYVVCKEHIKDKRSSSAHLLLSTLYVECKM